MTEIAHDPLAAAALLRVCDVRKNYRSGGGILEVLRGVDFAIEAGGFVAVIGQSGSGKSTLLHLMGLLDSPDSGEVHLAGTRIDNLPTARRDRLRNTDFGMVFPQIDGLLRHPSQLYEFTLEGVALFFILWAYASKPRASGAIAAVFLMGYGAFRFAVEYTREPDS